MNEQLQAAKDQAAREYGRTTYKSVQISVFDSNSKEESLKYLADLDLITNRAMEIYAEMVAVEFAERLRRNYTNHLTGGGGWRYYGDKKEKVITTQELFNRFNTKP